MELWIRSQHKGNLVKVHSIEIEARNNGDFEVWAYQEIHQVFLGEYKTKERALEVLDEIQQCLIMNFNMSGSYQEADIYLKTKMLNGLYGVIYNMPKE